MPSRPSRRRPPVGSELEGTVIRVLPQVELPSFAGAVQEAPAAAAVRATRA
jgi:hypothetical protein